MNLRIITMYTTWHPFLCLGTYLCNIILMRNVSPVYDVIKQLAMVHYTGHQAANTIHIYIYI